MKRERKRIEKIMHTDYSSAPLHEGENWHINGDVFLSLDDSKTHLMKKMTYIKTALDKAFTIYYNFESLINHVELTGELFADTLELGELLSITEMFAMDFIDAFENIECHEEHFRYEYLYGFRSNDSLPF